MRQNRIDDKSHNPTSRWTFWLITALLAAKNGRENVSSPGTMFNRQAMEITRYQWVVLKVHC